MSGYDVYGGFSGSSGSGGSPVRINVGDRVKIRKSCHRLPPDSPAWEDVGVVYKVITRESASRRSTKYHVRFRCTPNIEYIFDKEHLKSLGEFGTPEEVKAFAIRCGANQFDTCFEREPYVVTKPKGGGDGVLVGRFSGLF